MKRAIRFVLVLLVALVLVPFLPLYLRPTMLRSWRTHHVGDVIEWGWKVCTLSTFWSKYRYLNREQNPAFWLALNLGLAIIYALIVAAGVDFLLMRRRRRAITS